MIDTISQIVLIIVAPVIAIILYYQYKLPNKIKYISCFIQTKEIGTSSNSFISLFNFVNNTHANIEIIDFVIVFDTSTIISDTKIYGRNFTLKKIEKNELHLIIYNFNKKEKNVLKVFTNNSSGRSICFNSDTTGIKIKPADIKIPLIDFKKVYKKFISVFKINYDPLLNANTIEKGKKKKRNIIAVVGLIIALISLSCFVLTNYKTMHQNFKEIFGKDSLDIRKSVALPLK
jgi:hypothetical protein